MTATTKRKSHQIWQMVDDIEKIQWRNYHAKGSTQLKISLRTKEKEVKNVETINAFVCVRMEMDVCLYVCLM